MKREPHTGPVRQTTKTKGAQLAAIYVLAIACHAAPACASGAPRALQTAATTTQPEPSAPSQGAAGTIGPADRASQSEPGLRVEQIRSAQEQALQRRETLLRPESAITDPETRRALLERWGVEVKGVRKASGGYMIDFRFRVLDADKALPLFDPKVQPYLLREGSDIKLPVPVGQKVGAFRTTNRGKNIQANKDYYMLFANPDAYVKPGNKVSIIIGDFRVDGLTLQ